MPGCDGGARHRGRRLRPLPLAHWLLDPDCTYLNHGTVGATPRRVLDRQQALRDEMERQPSPLHAAGTRRQSADAWRRVSRLREASDLVAEFVGSRPDDLVFVANVTTGINAVLGSVALAPGDEVAITDLAYGAITLAARAVCDRSGATLRIVPIDYPVRDAADVVSSIVQALTPRTKLVVVDHVTAQTALILPVAAVAAACRARGVPVLVDGAHAPGSLRLDIASLGVDWYAANLHKWAHAPRGCGILWAAPDAAGRRSTRPVVSWGRDHGFRDEFEHTATLDPTSFLAAPEGIALLREWDFDAAVRYMHELAWEAGQTLCDRWGHAVRHSTRHGGRHGHGAAAGGGRHVRRGRGAAAIGAAPGGPHRAAAPRLARPPVGQDLRAGLQRSIGRRAIGRGRGATNVDCWDDPGAHSRPMSAEGR